MITPVNQCCQIEVVGEWEDPTSNLQYDFSAKVIIDRNYHVDTVDFLSIDVYDGGEPLEYDVALVLWNNKTVKENLEELAGNIAIEKVQSCDFESEAI